MTARPSARLSATTLFMAGLTLAMHAALLLCWHRVPVAARPAADLAMPVLQVRLVAPLRQAWQSAGKPVIEHAKDQPSASRDINSTEAPGDENPVGPILYSAPRPGPAQVSNAVDEALWRITPAESAYLPASQLDQRPLLQSEITLPFPENETLADGARVSAVLVLFISERGKVDKIEFGQSTLPPAFARVAVDGFERIHLRPGIKDGRPRRAMMKIEVEFTQPTPSQRFAGPVLESGRRWEGR